MKHLFRLLSAALVAAAFILIFAVGLERHDHNLLAPLNLFLTLLALAVYLLPTGLALYRDCKGEIWIAALNVFLGWTVLGWFIALGLAAAGQTRPRLRLVRPVHRPAASH